MKKTQNGFLIISDITGYTSYLSSSELEHAEDVLSSLLDVMIEHTRLPLNISRLEGDAVISYVPEGGILQGQTLMEMIETMYVGFRKSIDLMVLNTTCTCNACRNIGNLDLKFFVHYGTFLLQPLPNYTELIGNDVNLLHRLTKNRVLEETGLTAYVLYTQAALEKLGIQDMTRALPSYIEEYQHIGEVRVFVQDMHAVWENSQGQINLAIKPNEAYITVETVFPLPPVQLWDYVTKPEFKALFTLSDSALVLDRKGGRIGVGSSYQCAHGDVINPQIIIDWQPFDQYTYESPIPGGGKSIATILLTPVDEGTKLTVLASKYKGSNRLNALKYYIFAWFGLKVTHPKGFKQLRAQIEIDKQQGLSLPTEEIDIDLDEIRKSIRKNLKASG